MSELRITLPEGLQADRVGELARHLSRLSPLITGWVYDQEDSALWFSGDLDHELRARIAGSASDRVRTMETFRNRVLVDLRDQTHSPTCPDAEDALRRTGHLKEVAPGALALGGPAALLARRLDGIFADWGKTLGAEPWTFPALLGVQDLARSGYLRDFPHQANLVCHLPGHADDIKAAAGALATAGAAHFPPSAALSPTVCYHHFVAKADSRLNGPVELVTARCRCFRYEGDLRPTLSRVRDFEMREVVAVGSRDAVIDARNLMLAGLEDLLRALELGAWIETASDPFFTDVWEQGRIYQIGFDLKAEARFSVPGRQESVAIASVNHHLDHFGRAFGIMDADGESAHSCCIGFGIERWVLAVLTQHGLDPKSWPDSVAT